MARHEHLPLYKTSLELCLLLETAVRQFPRYHKYAIGNDLRQEARNLIRLVVRANQARNKQQTLIELREASEEMKLLVHLAFEVNAFTNKGQFSQAAKLAVEVARQSEGWLRAQVRGNVPNLEPGSQLQTGPEFDGENP